MQTDHLRLCNQQLTNTKVGVGGRLVWLLMLNLYGAIYCTVSTDATDTQLLCHLTDKSNKGFDWKINVECVEIIKMINIIFRWNQACLHKLFQMNYKSPPYLISEEMTYTAQCAARFKKHLFV